MRAPRPWLRTRGARRSTVQGDTNTKQNDCIAELPGTVLARLAAEGVTTLNEWPALGRRRFAIFGITRPMCAQIDTLAREAAE